ncbi:MAG: aminotransferase [Phycisphaerae bacterium]|nr:aminotransferase [Phycisphaerae bacterium]
MTIAELQQKDREHHLHPFTNHPDMHKTGTHIILRGEGCFLIDQDGRRLLDGLAGLWCVNVGYGRAEIVERVREQMTRLPYYCSFFNTTTEPAIELADRLASLTAGKTRLTHTIFCNSGSEANETALKLIRAYWKIRGKSPKKSKILSRTFSYHGVGIASTSLTGLPTCLAPFDLPLSGFIHVPGPYAWGADNGMNPEQYGQWCIEETRRIIQAEGADTIAALFAEPVQGAGGVIPPPKGYLPELRRLCREHDILFVADEVISGFGRLGDWFASNLWELDPDLMTLAKGITSGYLPLGATMVSREITETLNAGGYLAHGFTYSGHTASCACALANLDIIAREQLIERTRDETGPYFQQKLRELADHPAVGEVRGVQLIGAIELLPRGGRAELVRNPNTLGGKAAGIARKHGVIVRGIRDLIAMSPPLIITLEEIDLLFEGVRKTLDELWD